MIVFGVCSKILEPVYNFHDDVGTCAEKRLVVQLCSSDFGGLQLQTF